MIERRNGRSKKRQKIEAKDKGIGDQMGKEEGKASRTEIVTAMSHTMEGQVSLPPLHSTESSR